MTEVLYLLTGGTGLLGGNILRELLSRGAKVRVLTLPDDKAASSLPDGIEIVQGNLLDNAALERLFCVSSGEELIVIHSAGIVTLDPNPNETVRAVNVDGTRNIVNLCVKHKVKKLVYVSSTSVIPEPARGIPIYEIERFDPDAVTGYYAKTKTQATELVMRAVREHGLDACAVCPSGIFGPNDYGYGLITSCIKMVAEGRLRISIGGTFNSVDARDLANGILACAERGRKGESYIMSSRCYTFSQLLDAACKEAGVKPYLFTVPLWLVRPFAGIGALYGKLTGRPTWLSSYTIYNLKRNNDYSAEKAERELDFHCRPLEETIEDTIVWLKQEGKLSIKKGSALPIKKQLHTEMR